MASKHDHIIEMHIKALISRLTKFQEGTAIFNHVYDYFMAKLQPFDSAFSITKPEIDCKVEGLAEKMVFHGYLEESQMLKSLYMKYIETSLNKDDTKKKLSVMQFLFAMSRSPTTHLASLPGGFIAQLEPPEVKIDWSTYLMEGIETWQPNFDDSDEFTDEDDQHSQESPEGDDKDDVSTLLKMDSTLKLAADKSDEIFMQYLIEDPYMKCRKNLAESVQHQWFVSNVVRDLPDVDNPEANIAPRWESYLSSISHGLLGGSRTKLLSEYKVLRETIWQLFAPHNSVVFQWSGSRLIVNENVSIPSLRPFVFKNLVSAFLEDIHMLHELRSFHQRVMNDKRAPHTYRGYSEAAMSILQPAVQRIVQLEAELIQQETTMTLISFGNELKQILRDVKYLHRVHRAAILDYMVKPSHTCCMHLLTTLYRHLPTTIEKYEMDIVLTLYLEAAYKYVRIVEEWFRNDRLMDPQREFPLALRRTQFADDEEEDYELAPHEPRAIGKKESFERANYMLRDVGATWIRGPDDPLIALIKKEVLLIGRQLRLFNLLGKLHLLHETKFSIYDEWRSAIYDVLRNYSAVCGTSAEAECDEGVVVDKEPDDVDAARLMLEGVVNLERKYSTECDLLEHVVDTTDDFLMAAFRDVFYSVDEPVGPKRESTFATLRCKQMGERPLPGVQHFIAESLAAIIRHTYRDCGRILKDLFLRDHHLAEHAAILAKIFLFADDAIFPFYRAIFTKIEGNANWGNDIWLTHDLQDVLLDAHLRLCENLRVGVRQGWAAILEDPLRACTLIDVQYRVEWPIDLIVTARCAKMYREMFYFILKIKWALYTLNHLGYSREEQKRRQRAPRCVLTLLHRLELLRFGLTNVFAALQHYVLGYVYRVYRGRFECALEAAENLDALVKSHADFVDGMHRVVARVRDYQAKAFGFDRALYSVRQLRKMWLSPGDIIDQVLRKTEDSLKECHANIFDVIGAQIYD